MDLDRWIAENVMGFKFWNQIEDRVYYLNPDPLAVNKDPFQFTPKTDIAQAFEVVEKMRDNPSFQFIALERRKGHDQRYWWRCDVYDGRTVHSATEETPAIAICTVFYKAAKAAGGGNG